MKVLEGQLDASGLHFALIVSRFNEALTSRLELSLIHISEPTRPKR